jgi:hypothetical protein
MNRYALLLVPLVAIAGCKSKASTEKASASSAAVGLTDLSASLEAIRAQFNAHKQEARFLTLLSPA